MGLLNNVLPQSSWPLILAAYLGSRLWFGFNANRLLWEKEPWRVNVSELVKAQRSWGWVGLALNAGLLLLGTLMVFSGNGL